MPAPACWQQSGRAHATCDSAAVVHSSSVLGWPNPRAGACRPPMPPYRQPCPLCTPSLPAHLAEEEHSGLLLLHRRSQGVQAEGGARLRLQLHHLGAKAASHVRHARALQPRRHSGRGGGPSAGVHWQQALPGVELLGRSAGGEACGTDCGCPCMFHCTHHALPTCSAGPPTARSPQHSPKCRCCPPGSSRRAPAGWQWPAGGWEEAGRSVGCRGWHALPATHLRCCNASSPGFHSRARVSNKGNMPPTHHLHAAVASAARAQRVPAEGDCGRRGRQA